MVCLPSGLPFMPWAPLGQQGSDGPVPEPSPDPTVHCREEGLMQDVYLNF